MFEATLSGGWPNYARRAIEVINPAFCVFWLVYVITVIFAVIRVITALFLHATMVAAANDDEMMVMNKMKEKEKLVSKLKHFFSEVDTSGDGFIDREEFAEILEDPRMQAWLHVLELEVYEVAALFNLLDDGNGSISSDEFIGGAMRLKGNARAIDSITIMHEQHLIKGHLHRLCTGMHSLWNEMNLDGDYNPWPAPVRIADTDEDTMHGIRITIIGATGLRKADIGGHSDPYCEMWIPGKKKMMAKTPVIKDNENPMWDFSHVFTDFEPDDEIHFHIWDLDVAGDDSLGKARLSYDEAVPDAFEGELMIEDEKAAKQGFLMVKTEVLMQSEENKKKAVWQKIHSQATDAMVG
jgi:hypothetical protein